MTLINHIPYTCSININSTDVSIENLKLINMSIWTNRTSPELNMLKMSSVKVAQCSLAITSVDAHIEQTEIVETYFELYSNVKFHMLRFQGGIIISVSATGILTDCTFQESAILINESYLKWEECIFQDNNQTIEIYIMSNIMLGNCYAYNSSITVTNSTVTVSITGDSKFAGSNQAITLINSVIHLLGEVLFINNTGIRGAAMILYSSTLNIVPDTNVAFINNSAKDRGGAIYIEPGVSSIYQQFYFTCFYHLLNCTANVNYSFYFSNNSAASGGDDIYGAFLQDYFRCRPSLKLIAM